MEFRILQEQELANAAGLARYVFDTYLRECMEFPQTTSFVEEYLKVEHLLEMVREQKLTVWGGFENDQMIGVSGLQSDGMITMLYVLPQFSRRGCGGNLLNAMRIYAKKEYGIDRVSLNATPAWTAKYFLNRGFDLTYPKQNMPVPFVSMYATYDKLQMFTRKPVSGKVIAIAAIGGFVFATIFSCCYMVLYLF